MRVLVIGAGGVGEAIAAIARRRDFLERMLLADIDGGRARAVVDRLDDDRLAGTQLDASNADAIVALAREERADLVLNACDPRFNPPIFAAARSAGCNYLDMAMTLSEPHPDRPHEQPGVKLGDAQFDAAADWEQAGLLALVGMGVEPGFADVAARYAAAPRSSEVAGVAVRDGPDLVGGGYHSAPPSPIWPTIGECPTPPLIWERER